MTIRTSESDPLRIAALPVGSGLVGVTLCPGKQGDSVSGAGWARDLAMDVESIRDWGASAVVTLIEEHEFAMLGVQALPEAFREAGIEWHHLPVTDVHAPDQRFEIRWGYAGARLRERLRAGERLLVHCRGGLGRAGSVAARLLVEFGTTPSEAIRQVRAVRPGAIETRAQERWVAAQRAVVEARDTRTSRQLACLLGGAIGDALGYRVEFDSLAAIRREYGTEGIRLAAAGGIPVLWQRQAPGTTCLSALHAGALGSVDKPINDRKGCGGVMRTAPLGFLVEETSEADVYAHGVAAAALTHGHPDGWAPAGVMALAVRRLLGGASWIDVVEAGLSAMQVHPAATGTRQLLTEVDAALKSSKPVRASASFGLGWVGDEALAVGLHAAATASIAGQLYGAKYGLSALPANAVTRVDVLEPLLELFAEWEQVRSGSRP